MVFKEFLRVRSTLLWFTIVLVAITALIQVVAMISPESMTSNDSGSKTTTTARVKTPPHAGSRFHGARVPAGAVNVKVTRDVSGQANVTVTDERGNVHSTDGASNAPQVTPWVELFGLAGFIAAIVSTVLGSTLAQENDHLEVAWTRPRSRTGYATTLMSVDAAGIIIAQLVTFAFIVAHLATYHHDQHIISGPHDAIDAIRFALFPLAWYAVIVALSASMRGRAGVVQGLIWPITLGLTGLTTVPLPDIWHRITVAIALVNPLSYISEHDEAVRAIAGAAFPQFAVAALLLMVVASWAAATYQWRRLQA